ncbi:MAG: DNA repair protein RadA [Candidatus Woesebacteria bacterium]|nr:MAG: DNA repair protein RadA [Candidatus Woesebacteria bacterium]
MANRSQFVCQQCGYSQVKWSGKCPNCGSWGSMVETFLKDEKTSTKRTKSAINVVTLDKVNLERSPRISSGSSELDRVLGGGIVKGQVILIAGEPGIGKSTLLMQLANKVTSQDKKNKVFYASGEESALQIATRADRLKSKNPNIVILESTDIDAIISTLEENKKDVTLAIIDSIQTMSTSDLNGLAGSVGQVRECAFRLVNFGKKEGIPVFIVGHITKEGAVAGPAVLAHIVDTVLWFEGEKSLQLRLIRAVKNRFGPTDEVGIFEMTDRGLTSLTNADKIFLTQGAKNVSGSVVSSTMQGTRPVLVEIQSLTTPSKSAFPKRIAQGIDAKRMELIIAILIKRCSLPLYDQDIFVNVTGGIKIEENACDLAVALSISSSFYNKPFPNKTIAIGELGLLGEIREVIAQDKRIKEAKRLGFENVASAREFKYLNQAIKETMGR